MPGIRGIAELYEDIKMMREFISEFKVCRTEQFDQFLYNKDSRIKKKIRTQLVNRGFMHIIDDVCCVETEMERYYDEGVIKAIWVLLDFRDKLMFWGKSDYPAKAKFATTEGFYYVVVAEKGKENIINNFYLNNGDDETKYIVIIDSKSQIPKLTFDGVVAFCMVNDFGNVTYYRNGG